MPCSQKLASVFLRVEMIGAGFESRFSRALRGGGRPWRQQRLILVGRVREQSGLFLEDLACSVYCLNQACFQDLGRMWIQVVRNAPVETRSISCTTQV